MTEVSKILFWIVNGLLIPDIIILIILFIRSLLMIGSFYNQFLTRLKNKKNIDGLLWKIEEPDGLHNVRQTLPKDHKSLYTKYLEKLLNGKGNEAYLDFVLSGFDDEADKDLSTSRLLAKLGPVLGLIGTLIAMSPALVGLSTGDISGMAYNMQVVFATTVIGLIVSAVGLVTLQFKKRWYLNEASHLEYISQVILKNKRG